MNVANRIAAALVLCLSVVAALESVQYLRGDLMTFTTPPADADMSMRDAVRLEIRVAKGLRRSPLSWEGRVQQAGYQAVAGRYDDALDTLAEARKYSTAMPALALEASIYSEQRELEKALEAFELLYRLSVADRTTIQHLIRLYDQTTNYLRLRDFALEADMRWPNTFDALVAIANSHINSPDQTGDLPLIMKYLVLARHTPQTNFARPKPKVYELRDIQDRLEQASRYLGYDSSWAIWEKRATEGGSGMKR